VKTPSEKQGTPKSGDGIHQQVDPPADQSANAPQQCDPTLVHYFGEKKISAAAFIKAINLKKVLTFSEYDVELAVPLMAANDPDRKRLLDLASRANLPHAIDRWIWVTIQKQIKSEIDDTFNPYDSSANAVMKHMVSSLKDRVGSKDKKEKAHAANLLCLGMIWLSSQRSLDDWDVFQAIRDVYAKNKSQSLRAVKRIIRSAKTTSLKDAIAVITLTEHTTKDAIAELNQERRQNVSARAEIGDLRSEIEQLTLEIEKLQENIALQKSELDAVSLELRNNKQHSEVDKSSIMTEQRVLLLAKLNPLLNDAVDALEIDPPVIDISLERLNDAISLIKNSVEE
jgi:hypothetical protein